MKRKIGRSLLVVCLFIISYLGVKIKIQATEIQNAERKIQSARHIQNLVSQIENTDIEILEHKTKIDILREDKFVYCDQLGDDMPVSLIEVCGMPKTKTEE